MMTPQYYHNIHIKLINPLYVKYQFYLQEHFYNLQCLQ